MFVPVFFRLNFFEYISKVLTFPIDTSCCDIELAYDCFVFSWVTFCDQPYGVEACVMFSYDII